MNCHNSPASSLNAQNVDYLILQMHRIQSNNAAMLSICDNGSSGLKPLARTHVHTHTHTHTQVPPAGGTAGMAATVLHFMCVSAHRTILADSVKHTLVSQSLHKHQQTAGLGLPIFFPFIERKKSQKQEFVPCIALIAINTLG